MSIPSPDNSVPYDQLNSSQLEAELSHLERIVFDSAMMGHSHKQGEPSSTSDSPRTSADNVPVDYHSHDVLRGTALPQVPPEAYTYLIHALLSMQGVVPPSGDQSMSYPQVLSPGHPAMHSQSPAGMPLSHTSPLNTPPIETPHFHSDAPSDAGDTAEEAVLIAEDKRRRNTSASARFRIKKKLRTLNLERTVADLTGRTEELEREAAELRRENGWLKEIVLLKSRSAFGGSQSSSSQQSDIRSRQDGHNSDMINDH